jgi:hypothetical protein
MASPEERERHNRRRKRNVYAKILRDPGEMRGAYSMKIKPAKNQPYKRERIRLDDLIEEKEEND